MVVLVFFSFGPLQGQEHGIDERIGLMQQCLHDDGNADAEQNTDVLNCLVL